MLLSTAMALVLGQGMPFQGLVHESSLFLQKDPVNNVVAYPIATAQGKNFAIVKYSRSAIVELLSLDSTPPKLVSQFGKPGDSGYNFWTKANQDGTFWLAFRFTQATPSGVKPYRVRAILYGAEGQPKFDKELEGDCTGAMVADTDAAGNLYVGTLSQKIGGKQWAAKLGLDGEVKWAKELEVKPFYAIRTMTAASDVGVFFLASSLPGAQTADADRGIQVWRLNRETGQASEWVSKLPKLNELGSSSTAWKNLVYAATSNTDGTTSFLAIGANALNIAANTPVARETVNNVWSMVAHPKRGVFVGSDDASGKPIVSLFSYGGKRHWSQPAAPNVPKGAVTSLILDSYGDAYAAGSMNSGMFLTKLARSNGGGDFSQLVSSGVWDRTFVLPLAVNSLTGEVLAGNFGRVNRFAQCPVLSEKVIDMIEGETVVQTAIQGDRYVTGGEVVVVVKPKKGTLKIDKDGKFSYTPKKGFHGFDGFTYRVNKTSVSSYSGAVSFRIAAAPKGKG